MLVNIKWKKRESTKYFIVVKKKINGRKAIDLRNDAVRRGDFDLGFQYVVYSNGRIDEGRPEYAYAGHWFDDNEHSVAVLVDAAPDEELTAAQEKAIESLYRKYPTAEMKWSTQTEDLQD